MTQYDKIVKSTVAPKETGVVWIDVSTTPALIKVFNNGAWTIAGGVGGGGKSNLEVGTEEDRLAITEPYDGLEFNQVNINTETLKPYVVRYLYEDGQWRIIEAPITSDVETAYVHISTYDGQGSLSSVTVGVYNHSTGETKNYSLDNSGNCSFSIPKGNKYTVSVSSLSGYHNIPDNSFTALGDERSINLVFQSISSSTEIVEFHVTAYNANRVETPSLADEFIGDTITMTLDDGTTRTAQIGSNHIAKFEIPYGTSYSVVAPIKSGYMKIGHISWEHTASVPERILASHYMALPEGIKGVDANGTHYDYNAIEVMSAEEKANILYLSFTTSSLGEKGFMYKLPIATSNQQWASQNVTFDTDLLPYKQSHAAAITDIDGKTNTQHIIDIAEGLGITCNAATYCYNQTITVGGETKHGFLGAYGQMYALVANYDQINAFHTLLGKAAPGWKSGYWWTSTQFSSDRAVTLYNGSFYGDIKTNYGTTLPLFEL